MLPSIMREAATVRVAATERATARRGGKGGAGTEAGRQRRVVSRPRGA